MHYYDRKQDSKVKITPVFMNIRGIRFSFSLVSGTFSAKKVDKGTLILARGMLVDESWAMLDVGCGVGVLGVVAGRFCKKVYLSDPNERAVSFAKENLKLNNVTGVVGIGEYYIFNKKFDSILLNPPQTAGKEVCFRLISEGYDNLKKNGYMQVVARKNKGGESIKNKLEEIFGNVRVIAREAGYCIYVSKKE